MRLQQRKTGQALLALTNRLKGKKDKHCNRMLKRLRREKGHMFTFLEVDGVE